MSGTDTKTELNGIICMYKPKGFTSFDVIAKLRGILKMKRLGHGGTLDPMAEGVLPVFVGRAAMACDMLPDHDKVYEGGFKLGLSTDTQDITGTVTEERGYSRISREEIGSALENFRGDIMQIPPMYSAVSVDGKRLYELARQNITVERSPRPITVYSLELTEYDEEKGEGKLIISCSKGTYIRTLISDIGELLGTGAVMTSLVRTRACEFDMSDCTTFEQLQAEADRNGDLTRFLLPIDKVFGYLPSVYLTPGEERLYRNGIQLETKRICCRHESGRVRVCGSDGFIGTAEITAGRENGARILKSEKTFVLPKKDMNYKGGYAVALGIFDGVHRGHRSVIGETVRLAEELDLKAAVFTFRTDSVSEGGKVLRRSCLMSEEEKEFRIRDIGAEYIFSPPFSELKDMSAEDFVRIVLRNRMGAKAVVCGEDFRCGRGASCDAVQLYELCRKYGITLKTVPPVPDENGEKISSGRIRKLIAEGDISEAARLMGTGYVFRSKVINGRRLGRTLGFPTINQHIPRYMQLPRFGVYAARVEISGRSYDGLANVGVKPTVTDSGDILCETYIFDFDEDIYGLDVRTELLKFIREERKFSSKQELKAQVLSDIDKIKQELK
ncbi:MAG: tRNA pseudouridine(55) synthase TruB [Oscillospiraceae bacterium]